MSHRRVNPVFIAPLVLLVAMAVAPFFGIATAQDAPLPGAAVSGKPKPKARELLTTDNHTIRLELPGLESVKLERDASGEPFYSVTTDEAGKKIYSPQEFAEMLLKARTPRSWWQRLMNVSSWVGVVWVIVGLVGQILFTGRMIVQWIISEKHGKSIVPPSFWWMSLIGASMLLAYFTWRKDIVGFIGQATGWLIYVRNLYLIYMKPAVVSEKDGLLDPRDPDVQEEANEK